MTSESLAERMCARPPNMTAGMLGTLRRAAKDVYGAELPPHLAEAQVRAALLALPVAQERRCLIEPWVRHLCDSDQIRVLPDEDRASGAAVDDLHMLETAADAFARAQDAVQALLDSDAPEMAEWAEDLAPHLVAALSRESLAELRCQLNTLYEALKTEIDNARTVDRKSPKRIRDALDLSRAAYHAFATLTAKRPTLSVDWRSNKAYGSFLALVQALFDAFKVNASAEHFCKCVISWGVLPADDE